jgi:hypothetical protein
MSETYILNIKNVEYFTNTLKSTVPNVDAIVYEPIINTVEILGTFTEQDKTDISTFVETYTNPEKIIVKPRRIISSTLVSSTEKLDWVTILDWSADVIIQNIITSIKLEPSTTDNTYDETFRYKVRIVDVTNNTVLQEVEYYNNEYEDKVIPLTNFNLSLGNIDLELQVKKFNKGNGVYIKKTYIEYS